MISDPDFRIALRAAVATAVTCAILWLIWLFVATAPAHAAPDDPAAREWVRDRMQRLKANIVRRMDRGSLAREFDISSNFIDDADRPGKEIIEEFDNGITIHTKCDNRHTDEMIGVFYVSADGEVDASAQVGDGQPVLLEGWGARPDPSSPDRSGTAFVANDESGDDRLAVVAIPDFLVLGEDGLEFAIRDGRVHLNNGDDCRFIGTIELLSDN